MFTVGEYIQQIVNHVDGILITVGDEMLKTFITTPYQDTNLSQSILSLWLYYLLLLLQPFYGPLEFVRDYPDELTPERQNQEGKTNLDWLEQYIVSGSGINWAICKSAPCPRHITLTIHRCIIIERIFYISCSFCCLWMNQTNFYNTFSTISLWM